MKTISCNRAGLSLVFRNEKNEVLNRYWFTSENNVEAAHKAVNFALSKAREEDYDERYSLTRQGEAVLGEFRQAAPQPIEVVVHVNNAIDVTSISDAVADALNERVSSKTSSKTINP